MFNSTFSTLSTLLYGIGRTNEYVGRSFTLFQTLWQINFNRLLWAQNITIINASTAHMNGTLFVCKCSYVYNLMWTCLPPCTVIHVLHENDKINPKSSHLATTAIIFPILSPPINTLLYCFFLLAHSSAIANTYHNTMRWLTRPSYSKLLIHNVVWSTPYSIPRTPCCNFGRLPINTRNLSTQRKL